RPRAIGKVNTAYKLSIMAWDLNTIWFVIVGILFTGYAILDGFDLGVGILHLLTKTDEERRLMLNAIGPVWDGNEVWLVTGGGALFAAFPEAYATVFSAFYYPFILLLAALIFRAVSIELRSKSQIPELRKFWDVAFSAGSFLSAFLIGVAMGNIIWGIPLDDHFEYTGEFLYMLHPYALLCGVLVVSMFMLHGAMYIVLKTEGDLQAKARQWAEKAAVFFVGIYFIFNIMTVLNVPDVRTALAHRPHMWWIFVLDLVALALMLVHLNRRHDRRAFVYSCITMALMMALFGVTMYPDMVFSFPLSDNSLTIYNAASSAKTLEIMLIIACIGVPLVLTYTISIYWIFRGKVRITPESY
ncbi:MAG TPA: cytochrome d ubiquinol oxidase subunit II, partial [Opitutales bacterium]|nr:cytochrome d ubiquinol oxidase subunit II [Opitutales bacterium]